MNRLSTKDLLIVYGFRAIYNRFFQQHKIGKNGEKIGPLSGPFTQHLVQNCALKDFNHEKQDLLH